MSDEYSLYDAKAHLSRIVRQVREGGGSVVITVHGEPAVEIRPYTPPPMDIEARWAALEANGVVSRPTARPSDAPWKTVGKRTGGLKRFLEERGEE
jgi:prevent-host-death family protein